jgi:hypothetical protein
MFHRTRFLRHRCSVLSGLPDGTPRNRAGHSVQRALVDLSFSYEPTIYTVEADGDGRFTLRWYQHLPVSLRGARTLPNGDRVAGAWVRVEPDREKRVRVELVVR